MERQHVKRVPIVSNGQLVGIVTRANLVQAIATSRPGLDIPLSDDRIRNTILERAKTQRWWRMGILNVTVNRGIVDLWGTVDTRAERDALRVLAENTPGVVGVIDNLSIAPVDVW
jgi:CBS domain-containing protein